MLSIHDSVGLTIIDYYKFYWFKIITIGNGEFIYNKNFRKWAFIQDIPFPRIHSANGYLITLSNYSNYSIKESSLKLSAVTYCI